MRLTKSARRAGRALIPLLILGCALVAACRSGNTPRHGWTKRWGPLVPHKTFPADCGLCHLPDRWDALREGFTFDHAKKTGVPLEGAHVRAACLRCHNDIGPVEEFVARGCAGCHEDVHQGRLGNTCTRCHDQEGWRAGGLVAEHARTNFPLAGAHVAVACELCHLRAPTGDYRGVPTRCEFCHKDDLQRATSPDHAASGWVRSCERCHFPTGWSGANFTHSFFPLTGGHAGLTCIRCHTSGTFGPISRACDSCHMDDYNRTPTHVSSNYPRTCQTCHTTFTWTGATLNHVFPIQGPHRADCAVCHTGGNTSQFTCLVCHEHNRPDSDKDHDEVADYVYASAACLQCHPTGKD